MGVGGGVLRYEEEGSSSSSVGVNIVSNASPGVSASASPGDAADNRSSNALPAGFRRLQLGGGTNSNASGVSAGARSSIGGGINISSFARKSAAEKGRGCGGGSGGGNPLDF